MTPIASTRWRTIATVGLGLGAAAGLAAVFQKLRRDHSGSPDSAPAYTARQSDTSGETVGRTVTIRVPRGELFAYWRDFSKLPQFMENLEKIEPGSAEGLSTWFIHGPMGKVFEVKTQIIRETTDALIAWESTDGSEVKTEGCVTFEDAPGERGTRVSLIITYDQPGGAVGKAIANLTGAAPEMQARHDLKRFKMLMETGEIATSARCNDPASTPIKHPEEVA